MEDFVPFSIAKKLKEKGFNEGCYKYYENKELKWSSSPWIEPRYNSYMPHRISAPTISQVLKWLREAKRIDSGAVWDNRDGKWIGYIYEMDMPDLLGEYVLPNTYDSYEQAAMAGIEYVLDNLI